MNFKELTVAIIAGGRSRRFGSSKLEAMIDGQTLLDRTLDLAMQLAEHVILIANDAPSMGDRSIPVFADIFKGKGPIAGIHSALTYCQTPWMVVMPVDMPYLETGIYHYLSPFCTHENPVAAESDAGLEPLISFWPKSTLAAVEDCIQEEEFGLYHCLKRLGANQIDCSQAGAGFNPRLFTNINRPEDLIK